MCDPSRCDDTQCAIDELGKDTPATHFDVNKRHSKVTLYWFDDKKRLVKTEEHKALEGLDRGTRELWASAVIHEAGFKY